MQTAPSMLRKSLAVLAGYAVWTVLWLGGNVVFFAGATDAVGRGERYTDDGTLTLILGLSIVCSLVAGVVTASLARGAAGLATAIMAGLLLITGIGVQAGSWEQLPVWYHLTFLGLLVPVALVGGRAARR